MKTSLINARRERRYGKDVGKGESILWCGLSTQLLCTPLSNYPIPQALHPFKHEQYSLSSKYKRSHE